MRAKLYPRELKIEAIKQVVDHGYFVSSVTTHLDITTCSPYARIKKFGLDFYCNKERSNAQAEIR